MSGFPKRLFIALPVTNSGISSVAGELDKYSGLLKIVPDKNYHITVKFLGDTGKEKFDELVAGLDSGVIPCGTEYAVKGLGCFPGLSNPNVIWAGMEYDREKMKNIFRYVEKSAISAGFPAETRDFKPHLTLARVKRGVTVPAGLRDYIRENRDTFFSSSVFNKIVLYESELKKSGPEYSVAREWALA